MALPKVNTMTEQEYLAFERESDIKHEYLHGEVFAMTGASEKHNLLTINLITGINPQLDSDKCRLYPSDMRLKVAATGLYAYPDLQIVCGETELTDDDHLDTLLNPLVIIEVLSPSTERYDRGEKFRHYRQIPSLQAYVLVSQDAPLIECYQRNSDDTWTFTDAAGLDASIAIPPVDCTLPLADVYQKIDFDKQDDKQED